MGELRDGQSVEVQGSGRNRYTLERKGEVFSCSCPAWRNQGVAIGSRTCKHLRAYLGDGIETARVGTAAPVRTQRARPTPRRAPDGPREERERREDRRASLDRIVERFPAIHDRMEEVYGLRMPKHLAYAIGFWVGLDSEERDEAWAYLGTGPAGVGEWFVDDVLERKVIPGLDLRLQDRFRLDPPEMVTVFSGNSDGSHWGLWYDDPRELPSVVAHNWPRDSAETGPCAPTLLASLREGLVGPPGDDPWSPAEWPHHRAILAWFETVLALELRAHAEERIPSPPIRSGEMIGGMPSIDPRHGLPSELHGYVELDRRFAAYRDDDPIVGEWIEQAFAELKAGNPSRALFLGRELHWIDKDAWRKDCTELLVGAYRALDRGALAEIVELHHAHRDMAHVNVYETAEISPFKYAVMHTDLERLRTAGATSSDLAFGLDVANVDILEALLSRADIATVDVDKIVAGKIAHIVKNQPLRRQSPALADAADRQQAAVLFLFERLGVKGEGFKDARASGNEVLRAAAITHADLAWRSGRGRSLLHVAARTGDLEGVAALLDRGADPRTTDEEGKIPYDAARELWEQKPHEASLVFDLLSKRGGGPAGTVKPVDAGALGPGDTVSHAKFGDGVVSAVTGAGDDAKVTIAFADATKTLLAKFVKKKP